MEDFARLHSGFQWPNSDPYFTNHSMTECTLDFGLYPDHLKIDAGDITIRSLLDLETVVAEMRASTNVESDWVYAPAQPSRDSMTGVVLEKPYSARVFGLPKTHTIKHTKADSQDHLTFHLWSLSFFTGLRLTATDAGFLDATPLKPGTLVDFVLLGGGLPSSIELAEQFWRDNAANPRQTQRFAAAVHAFFLAQCPLSLQFERFLYLYTALDACYALASSASPPSRRIPHAERTAWMCQHFGMPVPDWADPNAVSGAEVAIIRNDAVHEALYMDEPLGFALHGVGTNQNLTLELEALVCRLLVALIGGRSADYIHTPVNTRQRHGLRLN